MIKILATKKSRNRFISFLGGLIGGLSISSYAWIIFMPLALSILWAKCDDKCSSFLWGFSFVMISHSWLLYLHPLTWLGFSWISSLLISLSIWFICSSLGGFFILLWGVFKKRIFLNCDIFAQTSYELIIKLLFLAFLWAIGELILSQTPFFWIGIGESLIPGDLFLAGLARWFGSSGLVIIQLLMGFWIFYTYINFRKGGDFKKNLFFGILFISLVHVIGALLIIPDTKISNYPLAIWQTNIPTRKKFLLSNKEMETKFVTAQEKALDQNAILLVAPEGTFSSEFKLLSTNKIDSLVGGFRLDENKLLRSSLLSFKRGENHFEEYIDKNRLVPLGERVPSIIRIFSSGLSSLGGISPGSRSRYFKWSKTPPLAVAICYEISNGNEIRKAVKSGSKLILSIANLDPYPTLIQKQFLSLAKMRSIENMRDNVLVSNTGPSGLIRGNGRLDKLLKHDIEENSIVYPVFREKITLYSKLGEFPLCLTFIFLCYLNFFKKS